MTTNDDPAAPISVEEAAALARVAGLPIPDERLPRLAADLMDTRALIADLAAVPIGSLPAVVDAFDPAWPRDAGGRHR